MTFTDHLQTELDRCGYSQADAHWKAAVASWRDDEAFARHMAAFRKISATWKSQEKSSGK